MKQVLLMAVLVAGMLLTGCSKEESNGMETKDNTEQTQSLKEQIVGVWRNGDYWVSFDGNGREYVEGEPIEFTMYGSQPTYYDGHNKAVLRKGKELFSDGGRYIIKGNIITVPHERGGDTKYVVTNIDETSVTFVITIPGSTDEEDYIYSMSFSKESDASASE